jgi:multidrug resistance efflux pump
LYFKTDGYVRDVYVAQGDLVEAGDLLAELEIGYLESQLAQAQVALRTAEANLAQAQQENTDSLAQAEVELLKAGTRLEQAEAKDISSAVTIAHVRLTQAQGILADAQDSYDQAWDSARDWELYMKEKTGCFPCPFGPSMSEQLEDERVFTEINLATAHDNLEIAQAEYTRAGSARGSHSYDLQLLAHDVTLIELGVEQLERGVDPLLALNVEKAHLDLERLRDQMEEAQLVAPFDGRVLSLTVREGSQATAFKPMLILGDPGALEITADLGADQLTLMSVGQSATIRLLDRPDRDWSGQVRQLPYPYGGGGGESADGDTAARIALDDPEVTLEIGELATIVIFLEQREDVLWLPPAAIRSFQGRDFVLVQDADLQRRADVRVGLESEERIEILEGVKEGQVVVGP